MTKALNGDCIATGKHDGATGKHDGATGQPGNAPRHPDCARCPVRDRMLFAGIDIAAATSILQPVVHLGYRPLDTLYRQGDILQHVFSVRAGLIKLSITTADGGLRIVRLIGPGATIGLEALVGAHGEHTAQAISQVDVCKIPVTAINRLAEQQPLLCKRLMAQWHDQLAQADTHLLELSTGPVRERVLNLLTMLDALCGEGNEGLTIPTNADCAALVAARRESVSRVMAEFKRSGILCRNEQGQWQLTAP